MALKINKTFNNGVTAPNCYAKIMGNDYEPYKGYTEPPAGFIISVSFFFDEAARNEDVHSNVIHREQYFIEDVTKETRDDQYTYLKTLDDFTGATDV